MGQYEELDEAYYEIYKAPYYILDLETTGLNPRINTILGVALATSKKQWYFKTRGDGGIPLNVIREKFRPVLADPLRLCIGHNLKFDIQFLMVAGFDFQNNIGDTMILAHMLDENRSGSGRLRLKGKGSLTDELFDVVLEEYGETALAGTLFGKDEAIYARDDVRWTYKCWRKLSPSLKRQGIYKLFHDVAMPTVKILAEMELTGLTLDIEYMQKYQRVVEAEIMAKEKEIYAIVGHKFNIGSADQLGEILYNEMKVEPLPGMLPGKSGNLSTAEEVISKFASQYPIAQAILDWRGLSKLITTYIMPLIKRAKMDENHRIYSTMLQTGTVTGRFCVAGDTLLETSEGLVAIEDLDLTKHTETTILTHRGNWKPVLRKVYKGEELMYEVSTESGKVIKCTKRHRFYSGEKWVELQDIKIGDGVVTYGVESGCLSKTRREYYGDIKQGVFWGGIAITGVITRGAQERGRESHSVLSSQTCLGGLLSSSNKGEGEHQLLQSLERKQARGAGKTVSYTTVRGSGEIVKTGFGCIPDSARVDNNGFFSSSKLKELWFDRAQSCAEKVAVLNAGIRSFTGAVQYGDWVEGRELPSRPISFLQRLVRSILKYIGFKGCYKGVVESALSSSKQRVDTKKPYLLVGESVRGTIIQRVTPTRCATYTLSEGGALLGGFFDRQFSGRGGWGVPQDGFTDTGAGRSKESVFGRKQLSGIPFYRQRCFIKHHGVCATGTGFSSDRVVSIKPVGVLGVWDIEVEDDHSYVGNGFVNHNSSSNPNMQNLPRQKDSIRRAFVAPKGKKLLITDYSQLELRVMAHRSQDPKMLEVYRTGGDIHQLTQDSLQLAERTVAKNCVVEGTYVHTASGYRAIESLGDADDGEWVDVDVPIVSYDGVRNATRFYNGGEQECVRVETELGFDCVQTLDHEVPVVRNGQLLLIQTKDLCVGDNAVIKVGADVHGDADADAVSVPELELDVVKQLPDVLLNATWERKREFFRAYFESNGCIKNDGVVSATSKSKKLIQQIQFEMLNIGIVGAVCECNVPSYGSYWTWSSRNVSLFMERVGFVSQRKVFAAAQLRVKGRRSVQYLDGFEKDLNLMRESLSGVDRDKITECVTHNIRFGDTRMTANVVSAMSDTMRFMHTNGLYTVKVRAITPVGKRQVYDLYEPVHKVMVTNGIVNGDCNFGLVYGLSPEGLKRTLWAKARLSKTIKECQTWRWRFFQTYEGVPKYHAKIEQQLQEKGYVTNLFGRRRRLKELAGRDYGSALRQAINFTIQSSAADLMLIAMRNFRRDLERMRLYDSDFNGVKLLMQVHDELVMEVPEHLINETIVLVRNAMENCVQLSVPLEAEPKVGDNWDAK